MTHDSRPARPTPFFPAMLAVLALLFCAASASSDADRISKMTSTVSSKASGMLNFNFDTFEKYIEAKQRSYGVFVYFSADSSICKPCAAMEKAVSRIAVEHRSLPARSQGRQPTFFAVMKLSGQDAEFLQRYGIRQVPLLHYFSPRARPGPLGGANLFDVQKEGFGPNQLRQFVNDRVGSNLRVKLANYHVPFVSTVKEFQYVFLGAGILGGSLALRTRAYAHPMFWFVCVVAVYIFSVGGGHYSWIHNTPLYVVNRDGNTEFMAGGSRSQYAAEGFFVSVTCVIISLCIILIQEMPNLVEFKAVQSMGGLMLAAMAYVAISILLTLYHWVCFFFFWRACAVWLFGYANDFFSFLVLFAVCRKCLGILYTTRFRRVISCTVQKLNEVADLPNACLLPRYGLCSTHCTVIFSLVCFFRNDGNLLEIFSVLHKTYNYCTESPLNFYAAAWRVQ